MKKFSALVLAGLVSVSSLASVAELATPEMNSYSLQAQLFKALEGYYPLEIAHNPVRQVAGGYMVADKNGASILSCYAGSPGLLAVQQYHCSVKGQLNTVGPNLLRVMSNAGKTVQQGANHGYVVAGTNYDLTCLNSGRSMLVTCKFSKGSKKQ